MAAEHGLVRAVLRAAQRTRPRHASLSDPHASSAPDAVPAASRAVAGTQPVGGAAPARWRLAASSSRRDGAPPDLGATGGAHARRVARRPRRRDAGGAAGDHGAWAGGTGAPAARPAAGRLPGARRRPWWRRSGALLYSYLFADGIGLSTWCHALACRSLVGIVVSTGEGYPNEVPGHQKSGGERL